ncbi:uncharacterized protein LOC118762022, partial [Octopus sinensis]|uniref:Uncharacterized protein LOC118762022 n=1 Tax=Octopus sinensis TaxID=2607531 RepID=A0A7E6EKL7_9MOLL
MAEASEADTESNGQTISRDTSKDLNKSESENLLYPTSGHSNSVEESLPSPISDTYDETSETKKCLDPIEEDGNQDGKLLFTSFDSTTATEMCLNLEPSGCVANMLATQPHLCTYVDICDCHQNEVQ